MHVSFLSLTTTPSMDRNSSIDNKETNEWIEHEQGAEVAALATYVPGSDAEKRLVRRIDRRIVPIIWLLYTLSYLDRANIGNAKTGGLEEDFRLTSTQYSVILLLFFVTYVVFELPLNLLLTRMRPSIYLSVLCFAWGAVAACMGAVQNWQQLAAVRLILGITEAGFAPGVAFFLSSWYRQYELAKRFAIYYTATAVSGAFSGLLAGVITQHMDGTAGIRGWRWLLILEGAASCFVALFAWKILPDWPGTTMWLSPEERLLASQRLAYDNVGDTQGEAGGHVGHGKAAMMAICDWRTWLFVVTYMMVTGAQTIQYFVPTLVAQLGYKGYSAQYHTIPVYASAFVFILVFCFLSDYRQERANYISLAALIAGICFIIVNVVDSLNVKYGLLIIAIGAVYAMPPLTLMWVPNVISSPAAKRAGCIAIVNALGNSASIYGVFLWPAKDKPRYTQGFAATTAFVFVAGILAQVIKYLTKKYPIERIDAEANLAATRAKQAEKVQREEI